MKTETDILIELGYEYYNLLDAKEQTDFIVEAMNKYAAQFQQEWVDVINKQISQLENHRAAYPLNKAALQRANELRKILSLLPPPPSK